MEHLNTPGIGNDSVLATIVDSTKRLFSVKRNPMNVESAVRNEAVIITDIFNIKSVIASQHSSDYRQ